MRARGKTSARADIQDWQGLTWRVVALTVLVAACYAWVSAGVAESVLYPRTSIEKLAATRGRSGAMVHGTRGTIYDRHMRPLAVSAQTHTLAIQPGFFRDQEESWDKLAKALSWTDKELDKAQRRLARAGRRRLIYMQRQLGYEESRRVDTLKIKGVVLSPEDKRFYPAGESAATLVGLTDIDGRGLEGLESSWDDILSPQLGRLRSQIDAKGNTIGNQSWVESPQRGQNLVLSLDAQIQYLAYRELIAGVTRAGAKSGSVVAVDVHTGAILGLASWPSYNPNDRSSLLLQPNRPAVSLIEPGSAIKPFTVAAALTSGQWSWEDSIDTSPGYVEVGNNRFADLRDFGRLKLSEVLVRSSQVGAAKLALALPSEHLTHTLEAFGFGQPMALGIPWEPEGVVPHHREINAVRQATLGFGYGLSATALQLAQAYTVIAADGLARPLHLVRDVWHPEPQRVISPALAREIREVLGLAVLRGTGKRGAVNRLSRWWQDRHLSSRGEQRLRSPQISRPCSLALCR